MENISRCGVFRFGAFFAGGMGRRIATIASDKEEAEEKFRSREQ